MSSDSLQAVFRVVDVLEELGVRYHFGGSWASSIHGVPRQTLDLDLVVDLPHSLAPLLVSRLESEFYLDEERIHHAIQRHISFNLIHLATGFKIDMFPHGPGDFDRLEFERSGPQRIGADQERRVFVKSAEDILLRKLQWYRIGGETSERQWTDVLGILKEQGDRLDQDYMRRWAEDLEVLDLLEKALPSRSE
jgi:hypothetical protein